MQKKLGRQPPVTNVRSTISTCRATILVFVVVFSITLLVLSRTSNNNPPTPQYILDEQNNIIGGWTSEEDINWTLIFSKDGKCRSYYGTDLLSTYTFSLTNTSPQCGEDVSTDETINTSYLQLTDISDGSAFCYRINAVTNYL